MSHNFHYFFAAMGWGKKSLLLFALLFYYLPVIAALELNNSNNPLLQVYFESDTEQHQLLGFLSPWEINADHLLVNPSAREQEKLKQLGFKTKIIAANRNELFPRHSKRRSINAGMYHTYTELKSSLEQLLTDYPNLASLHDIGDSWEKTQGIADRDIWAIKISTNAATSKKDKRVLFVGAHHAREWISVEVPLLLAKYLLENYAHNTHIQSLLSNGEIWIVPMVNPDGHQYSVDVDRWWRKNRRPNSDGSFGVDLNRNYAYKWSEPGSSDDPSANTYHGVSAFSESETQAIRDLAYQYHFNAMISYHSYGEQLFFPWNYDTISPLEKNLLETLAIEMGELITNVSGKQYEINQAAYDYPASGTTDDWFYAQFKTASFTIELPPNGNPYFELQESEIQPSFEENLPLALHLIKWSQLKNPQPKVEFNNSQQLKTLSNKMPIDIAIAMSAGNRKELLADWWLYADSPQGKYYYSATTGQWRSGMQLSYQGKVFDMDFSKVLNNAILPEGNYILYFGLETHADGVLDEDILFLEQFPFTVTTE